MVWSSSGPSFFEQGVSDLFQQGAGLARPPGPPVRQGQAVSGCERIAMIGPENPHLGVSHLLVQGYRFVYLSGIVDGRGVLGHDCESVRVIRA